MIGYKALDRELKCRGFQFEVGKTYTKDTPRNEMQCCTDTVFHFCRELFAIEKESQYKLSESRICEVIAGDVVRNGDKYGTNKITILREIVGEEKQNLINSGNCNSGNRNSGDWNSGNWNSGNCNSGNWNSGDWNSGNRNSGNWNSGNWNSGDWNSGNRNSGDWNSGNRNSGNRNSGNRNSGNWNSGNRNSGDWNSGNWNSGNLNTNTPNFRIFNRETEVDRNSIEYPDFFYFELAVFVSYDTASDEERVAHKKDIETCGGFLKTISYKDAWRKSWEKATDEDRRKVLRLPNWNNEIFKEISGIDVEKELNLKTDINEKDNV